MNNRAGSGEVWGQVGTHCILGKARLDETDLERGLTPYGRNCSCLLNLFRVSEKVTTDRMVNSVVNNTAK